MKHLNWEKMKKKYGNNLTKSKRGLVTIKVKGVVSFLLYHGWTRERRR